MTNSGSHLMHAVKSLKAPAEVQCVAGRWSELQTPSVQRSAEKMAALRAAVLSGSGRTLLSTPKTIKTSTVSPSLNVFSCLLNCFCDMPVRSPETQLTLARIHSVG